MKKRSGKRFEGNDSVFLKKNFFLTYVKMAKSMRKSGRKSAKRSCNRGNKRGSVVVKGHSKKVRVSGHKRRSPK